MGWLNRQKYKDHKPGQRVKYATDPGKRGPTKQEFREESDINWLMATYAGQIPRLPDGTGMVFADLTTVPQFRDHVLMVEEAKAAFAALPSKLRERFNNDPVALVEFVQNDANYDEAVRLGLVVKKEPLKEAPKIAVKASGQGSEATAADKPVQGA